MRVSKRGEYALRSLINLGLAQELGRPLLKIGEMAQREDIPVKFLEQILLQLKTAGYLDSKRGKHGGYCIKRPMRQIIIGDVVRLIDGPLAPIRCASVTAYQPCSCPDEAHCGLRLLMVDVRNAIAAILDHYTLADIVDVTLRKIRRDKVPLPFARKQEDKS
jgi:Rrf2 family protein